MKVQLLNGKLRSSELHATAVGRVVSTAIYTNDRFSRGTAASTVTLLQHFSR